MTSYKFENVSDVRSKTMKAVRSKNTSLEILLRSALFRRGMRYRIHCQDLAGNPDIVFIRTKIAIFCDGEFWHGKNWNIKKKKILKNRDYWIPKIERNIQRDKEINKVLKKNGWKVLRYWEGDIKKNLEAIVDNIICCVKKRKA
jgi:DNA mismatch endonuclease (patch repair protein)